MLSREEFTARIGCAGWALPGGVRQRFPAAGTILQRYAHGKRCHGELYVVHL
jgi:hypothetical protein